MQQQKSQHTIGKSFFFFFSIFFRHKIIQLNFFSSSFLLLKFDDIPIETSGENIPEPVLEYDVGLLGQELMENVRRANFQRPTPVQKYSIPIGLKLHL